MFIASEYRPIFLLILFNEKMIQNGKILQLCINIL